jgi:hypothetical protein
MEGTTVTPAVLPPVPFRFPLRRFCATAIKYGIHAESIVIPGENPDEYQAFVKFQLDAWRPQDTAEQQCVDQLTTDS